MKSYCTAFIALAAALAIAPAAKADNYVFSASGTEGNGQAVSINALIDLTSIGGGQYSLTGASGTLVDPWGNTDTITGVAAGGYVDPFTFDNLVSVPAAYGDGSGNLFYFDTNGILLTTNVAGYDVGVAPDEYYSDHNYQWADTGLNGTVSYISGDWPYNTTDLNVSLTPAPTPEPSSLLLLGTGLIGLAFVAFRKSKLARHPGFSLGAL